MRVREWVPTPFPPKPYVRISRIRLSTRFALPGKRHRTRSFHHDKNSVAKPFALLRITRWPVAPGGHRLDTGSGALYLATPRPVLRSKTEPRRRSWPLSLACSEVDASPWLAAVP